MGIMLQKTVIALASVWSPHGCMLKAPPPPCLCLGTGDAQRTILVMYSEWQGRSMELLTEQQSGQNLEMSACKIHTPPPDGYLDGAVAAMLGLFGDSATVFFKDSISFFMVSALFFISSACFLSF